MEDRHTSFVKKFVGMDSVVQVNEKGPEGFVGCFVIVTEMRNYGIQGCVPVPSETGTIWLNLEWEQMEFIGQAILKPQPNKDGNKTI
jgi:hypothetical protein